LKLKQQEAAVSNCILNGQHRKDGQNDPKKTALCDTMTRIFEKGVSERWKKDLEIVSDRTIYIFVKASFPKRQT